MNPIELGLFSGRINAICAEMGAVLQRSALSPNIRDRLDFSCALFDATGELLGQAAHIPVHLGSMAYAMRDLVSRCDWEMGSMVVLNDPFQGGTHLPDVTLIAPLFIDHQLIAFVVNRAHHAHIGAVTPGSMPLSTTLEEEGVLLSPQRLLRNGAIDEPLFESLMAKLGHNQQSRGDFQAQVSANRIGLQRLQQRVTQMGLAAFDEAGVALNRYGERLARQTIAAMADGCYRFSDQLDSDGVGDQPLRLQVAVTIAGEQMEVDFNGSAPECRGNLNAPLSVAAAGVYYLFRCLMATDTPLVGGFFVRWLLKPPQDHYSMPTHRRRWRQVMWRRVPEWSI